MPISNAYIPESVILSEAITKNGMVKSDSLHSFNSKSSENSERLYSDSGPVSRLDSMHDKVHAFLPYKRKSFWTKRSSIHKLEDFSNHQSAAYYSDFYDSTEQLPAMKKCENFHKRNAFSNWSSESDLFKRQATRRFSLNTDVLRKVETPKRLPLSFSSDNIDSFRIFEEFSDWNDSFGKLSSAQKSVGFEESINSSNFDNLSNSQGSNSDYEESMKKSIREYFKNSINRGSTSSLCTSQSSSYAMSPFPEETVDPFEELDDVAAEEDEGPLLSSPTPTNHDNLPLYSSLLNLRSTAAEQMLINLGFCHSSQLIPVRFFQNWPKEENGEALKNSCKEEIESKLQEDNQLKNSKESLQDTVSKSSKKKREDTVSKSSKERHEDTVSKSSKERCEDTISKSSKERREDTISKSKKSRKIDSNVEHLLMNKKSAFSLSNKSNSVDFEEINRSTVHILNNNKHVFYKQKSILDEIEEANRNVKNKPNEENSLTCKREQNENDTDQETQSAQNYNKPSFEKNINVEKGVKDLSILQKNNDSQINTENASCSRTCISNEKTPVSKISDKSQESFEIECIFNDSQQKSAELRTKSKEEKNSNEEMKSTDKRFLNPCLFLSVSCTSSPAESPLTVIDVPVQNNKDQISASNEEYIKKNINNNNNNKSRLSIDSNSDDTLNNMSDDQFDENSSNFHFIQEEFSNAKKIPSISIKVSNSSLSDINDSGVEELYSKEEDNCCQNANQLNPYLTFGPDEVTIYKNSSDKVNNEDNNTTELSPPESFTSSFTMFIKSPQKKRVAHHYPQSLNERKRFHSTTFSPLVKNGIRFDGSNWNQHHFSERGFGDGEDTRESKVYHAASHFSSNPKIEKTVHCLEKSKNKRDECCNPNECKEKHRSEYGSKSSSSRGRGENKSHCPETKVSKASIIFKLDSQNTLNNNMSSKVIIKNINCSQRKWPRQRLNPTYEKQSKDSSTQCNFEDHLNQRNLCNNDNINSSIQNYSKKYILKNSCQQTADLHMESKDRKMLPISKKGMLTGANFKKNGSSSSSKDDNEELDISTDFNPTSRRLKNSCTEKAILSLHKSSQTRIGGLHPSCKNELNICANCLNYKNWSCL